MYDTSLSSECSISHTSLSSSVSFMSDIGLFSDDLSISSWSGSSSPSPDSTASSSPSSSSSCSASVFADLAWFELSLTTDCVSSSASSYRKGLQQFFERETRDQLNSVHHKVNRSMTVPRFEFEARRLIPTKIKHHIRRVCQPQKA